MQKKIYKGSLAKYLMGGTCLVIFASMLDEGIANAQVVAASGNDVEEVIVVGSRASQQSANERKKRAKTAQDSIVADDVGSFPDRNLNEALSRIPGAAIERNAFGEGEGVTIRGNGPDLTRVEMDGMGVMSSGFDIAVSGSGGGGRSADMRELPADLIKSVDVIKGNTPDLTEGGLGASVIIKTRSGLDFKKPYIQLRVGGERNSLSERFSPDIGLVASRKFLDNRLGVIFNLTSRKVLNDSHALNNAGANNQAGYTRFADFDNSLEKTFEFNPNLVSGPDADAPFSFAGATTGTTFDTNTPRSVLEKSAQAQTKAQCDTLFPLLTQTELNQITNASNGTTRASASNQRINERITCLNQWNDYAPNLVRDQMVTQYEDRLSWDIRFDYRVNDNFTVYAKYAVTNRLQEENNRSRTRGGISSISAASQDNVTVPFITNTTFPFNSIQQLAVVPGSGWSLYNGNHATGTVTLDNTAGSTTTNNGFPIYGVAVNVVPGSIEVDSNHHLTRFDITNASVNIDHIRNDQNWKNSYVQFGGNYRNDTLNIDFMTSRAESSYSRYDKRLSRGYVYGNATMFVNDAGVWDFILPSTYDETDMTNYVRLNNPVGTTPALQAQAARYTNNTTIQFNPRLNEGEEIQAKFDLSYSLEDRLPFFTNFKTGAQFREYKLNAWGGGGYSPKAGVFVPSLNARGAIRACENQPTTTAANQCVFGYTPNPTTGSTFLWGTETMTPQQMVELYQSSVEYDNPTFFNGYEGIDVKSWNSIDVDKVYEQLIQTQNFNFDCMKKCKGTDGIVYDQPLSKSTETITAGYYMAEFEQALPFGMEFNGNFGVRMVKTDVVGSGFITLTAINKNSSFNPALPDLAAGLTTVSITKPVEINKSYTDWLPSYNVALWVIPDQVVLRYNWSKAISRPSLGQQWPTGTCTYDQRREEDQVDSDGSDRDMTCGTFGNPDLKPYTARKNNTSIEWYPNRDTSISLAYFRQKVIIGRPIQVNVANVPLFEGTGEVEPGTGRPLSDFEFGYRTYVNGPGYTQSGWEFSSKTAFTFLPWYLRHTGADFNISTTKAANSAANYDPITGETLDPAGQAKYFANLSLWYDDGKTNIRVAYQKRDRVFSCISGCGGNTVNNFPTTNPGTFVRIPYNPGEPYYQSGYEYLDAKASYKFTPNVEVYLEGRNLLEAATTRIGSDDRGFENRENPWSIGYGGRRFMFGVTYKM